MVTLTNVAHSCDTHEIHLTIFFHLKITVIHGKHGSAQFTALIHYVQTPQLNLACSFKFTTLIQYMQV